MNNRVRLLLTLGLGAIAAGINWSLMRSLGDEETYTQLTRDIKAGEPFEEGAIGKLTLRGGPGFKRVALRYNDRFVLFGSPAPRDLHKDDLVLRRDATPSALELNLKPDQRALSVSLEGLDVNPSLLQVGDEVDFVLALSGPGMPEEAHNSGRAAVDDGNVEFVGPFRVLSVGARVRRRVVEADARERSDGSSEKNITVAIELNSVDRQPDEMSMKLVKATKESSYGGRRLVKVVWRPSRKRG
jgi:hypothetical protein